jgi:hypothetical protein
MNLLIKSIRWTQSCPQTGGGLLRRREDNMTRLILAICDRAPSALRSLPNRLSVRPVFVLFCKNSARLIPYGLSPESNRL